MFDFSLFLNKPFSCPIRCFLYQSSIYDEVLEFIFINYPEYFE